ncbi:MAG: hypothetical protein ACRDTS_09065 [Mycobacterium sp.]
MKWTQQGWSMIDNFGPGGVQDWQLAARNLANHVAAHPLPAGPGLFEVLLAGDGNHAELGWTVGTTIYLVYNDHSEIDAADLAAAMTAHH